MGVGKWERKLHPGTGFGTSWLAAPTPGLPPPQLQAQPSRRTAGPTSDAWFTHPTSLPRFFLGSLKSAMIHGCREPPYPSILTDATMERLALAKFVAQESKREVRGPAAAPQQQEQSLEAPCSARLPGPSPVMGRGGLGHAGRQGATCGIPVSTPGLFREGQDCQGAPCSVPAA